MFTHTSRGLAHTSRAPPHSTPTISLLQPPTASTQPKATPESHFCARNGLLTLLTAED